MATANPDIGTGTTLSFSGVTANLLSLTMSGLSREVVRSSHMGTTPAHTFLFGDLFDPGTLVAEQQFLATEDPGSPLTAAASNLCITFPGTTPTTWNANAGLVDYGFAIPLEDIMTQTSEFKITGDWTIT